MKKGYKNNIEKLTLENEDFRKVLYTGEESQLVLMSLLPGEEIGTETHPGNDQFFKFESGKGKVVINDSDYAVEGGDAVVIPKGSVHNIINTGDQRLKMYTIYSPAHHRDGVVRKTKAEAEIDSPEFDGVTTE